MYRPRFFEAEKGDFMKEWAVPFYSSLAWKQLREYVKKRDKYLCVDCLKKGKLTSAEEVHHVVTLTPENISDPSISLNEELLVSLCRECHQARHGARARRYKVDDFGRVTIK